MPTPLLLPFGLCLVKEGPDGSDRHCWIKTVSHSAQCPKRQHRCSRVHSRYLCTIADLPSSGQSVRLQTQLRRFFCDLEGCSRNTVRKWAATGCFREQPPRSRGSRLLAPLVS
jgi:hypothetical protein